MLDHLEMSASESQLRELESWRATLEAQYPKAEIKEWTVHQLDLHEPKSGTLVVRVELGYPDDEEEPYQHAVRQRIVALISPRGLLNTLTPKDLFREDL